MLLQDTSLERVVPYERDVRDPRQPPVDGLAECVCLHACVYDPELIDQFDLGPMLTFPEHREIWRILKVTRARTRALDPAEFLVHFWGDLSAAHPQNWELYDDLLTSVADREHARAWTEYQEGDGDMPYTTFLHDFCWWLRRLQKVAQARRGIEAAQRIAENFWRAPDRDFGANDALAVLRRALPPEDIRIEL